MLRLGIDPEKPYRATFICQDGLCCCNMALISFRLFRKNLGNLRDFFGQMVYRPPWQKISRTPMWTAVILWNSFSSWTPIKVWKDNPFQWTIYTIHVNRLIKGSTADHRRSKCTNHSGASCFTWLRITIQPHSLMKTSQNAACSRNIALLITRDIVRQDSLNG